MQCPTWLLALVILSADGSGVDGQCWNNAKCTDLSTQEKIMDCIKQCMSNLADSSAEIVPSKQKHSSEEEEEEEEEEEDSLSLGLLLSALVPAHAPYAHKPGAGHLRNVDRRSYSMEHFRWGKPMGRKRRPVKVYTGGPREEEGSEEESLETPYPSQNRRQLDSREIQDVPNSQDEKKNVKNTEKYRMTHFRWSVPPVGKRYGGFMKPWSEQSQKPLITLFRNIIVKDGR